MMRTNFFAANFDSIQVFDSELFICLKNSKGLNIIMHIFYYMTLMNKNKTSESESKL